MFYIYMEYSHNFSFFCLLAKYCASVLDFNIVSVVYLNTHTKMFIPESHTLCNIKKIPENRSKTNFNIRIKTRFFIYSPRAYNIL